MGSDKVATQTETVFDVFSELVAHRKAQSIEACCLSFCKYEARRQFADLAGVEQGAVVIKRLLNVLHPGDYRSWARADDTQRVLAAARQWAQQVDEGRETIPPL